MKIAVLSGKGGTGKTLVSVNLAMVSKAAHYIDCDVEEPNGHLFLKPKNIQTHRVDVTTAVVDKDKCIGCRKCVDFCKFNALAYVKNNVMVFNEICHSCGGCTIVCPTGAMGEFKKTIGYKKEGENYGVKVSSGILNTGEASGVPIINSLLNSCKDSKLSSKDGELGYQDSKLNIEGNKISLVEEDVIIDCPPGSACVVMESIKDADYCILVAEPTIFGAHNLEIVYRLVKLFGKPHGVVLNKVIDGHNPSRVLCEKENIKILAEIPFDKEVGRLNASGEIIVTRSDKHRQLFENILDEIKKEGLK